MIINSFSLEIAVICLATVYLLYKYGNYRKQNFFVTLSVFFSWYFSFIIVCILPLDVASTAYRQCRKDNRGSTTVIPVSPINSSTINSSVFNQSFSIQETEFPELSEENECGQPGRYTSDTMLQSFWRNVYWSTQALTWIILPLMQSYSTSGDFTILKKLKTAVVQNAIYYGTYLVIFGVLLIYVVMRPNSSLSWGHLKVICITASNTWGLFLLVLLEGYGLVEIPRKLWNTTKKGYMLGFLYFKASKLSAARCEAEESLDDLIEEALHISQSVADNHNFKSHVDLILEKIPSEKITGFQVRSRSEDNNHISFDEKSLAKLHKQVIKALHVYHRTECQWNMLLEQIFHWEDVAQNENNREKIFRSTTQPSRFEYWRFYSQLEWYWYCMFRNWVCRALCILLCTLSAAVVWSELTFFAQSPTLSVFAIFIKSARASYNYLFIEIISTTTIAYLCVCAYYSVFRIKIMNCYYLAPRHQTNEYSLIFCGMLISRLTPPLCLNFLGLTHLDSHVTRNSNIEETSYTKIMGHMDVIPIISDGFNIYFPMLIFFVFLATYFNVCSRALHFVGFAQFIGDDEITSDLVDEGKELVKREKNRRQRLESRENRKRQQSSYVSRFSRSSLRILRDTGLPGSSPEESSRTELLKEMEPVDCSEGRTYSSGDFVSNLQHDEAPIEETYSRASSFRIGHPHPGIFDDV